MASEPVQVFNHTASFDSYGRGWNQLQIVVTFDGTYTIKLTQVAGPTYTRDQVEYIRDVPYLPKSVLTMLSVTGQPGGIHPIIGALQTICLKTLHEDYKEIETKVASKLHAEYEQTTDKLHKELASATELIKHLREKLETSHKEKKSLRSDLASSHKRMEELMDDLTSACETVSETQKKCDDLQEQNTQLVDTLMKQLHEIDQLKQSKPELDSLDTMLDSAFADLHM
jgi:hypothetical protein